MSCVVSASQGCETQKTHTHNTHAQEFGFRFLFVCVAMVVTAIFNGLIEQVGLYLGALMMCAGVVVLIIAALCVATRGSLSVGFVGLILALVPRQVPGQGRR